MVTGRQDWQRTVVSHCPEGGANVAVSVLVAVVPERRKYESERDHRGIYELVVLYRKDSPKYRDKTEGVPIRQPLRVLRRCRPMRFDSGRTINRSGRPSTFHTVERCQDSLTGPRNRSPGQACLVRDKLY